MSPRRQLPYIHNVNRRHVEFGCGIVVVGLVAGLAGVATTLLLHAVEHLTYHYTFGSLLEGVTGASPVRRAVGPMIGGALAGFGWWLLRRRLSATIANHKPIPRLPLTLDAGLQVFLVGSGASLGREGLLAPLAFGVGAAFNRIMDRARPSVTPTSWLLIPAIAAAGLLIGLCSIRWPELPGNGKSILTVSLNSGMTLAAAVMIFLLKPLLTAAFLRAGAVGGMLTPALATGSAMESIVALSINSWTEYSVSVAAVSLTCAAGVLSITQGAPVWAALFVWELARPPWWMLLPFLVAATAAHGLRVLSERRNIAPAR